MKEVTFSLRIVLELESSSFSVTNLCLSWGEEVPGTLGFAVFFPSDM